jgi:hypothetical protein
MFLFLNCVINSQRNYVMSILTCTFHSYVLLYVHTYTKPWANPMNAELTAHSYRLKTHYIGYFFVYRYFI